MQMDTAPLHPSAGMNNSLTAFYSQPVHAAQPSSAAPAAAVAALQQSAAGKAAAHAILPPSILAMVTQPRQADANGRLAGSAMTQQGMTQPTVTQQGMSQPTVTQQGMSQHSHETALLHRLAQQAGISYNPQSSAATANAMPAASHTPQIESTATDQIVQQGNLPSSPAMPPAVQQSAELHIGSMPIQATADNAAPVKQQQQHSNPSDDLATAGAGKPAKVHSKAERSKSKRRGSE